MARNMAACASCIRRVQTLLPGITLAGEPARLFHTGRPLAATASALSSDAPQSLEVQPASSGLPEKRSREKLQRAVNKHLQHLDDPWNIAQYVERALERDAFDEALLLVQQASKDKQVVVAWNHLIDHHLSNQKPKLAIKLYNEMKKRGQLPNIKTFTIIFRGLAKSQHPKFAVVEAVKYYNVLLKDSRLEPNTIHLNAVLNVCAKAGDLDSMFLIADTLNDSTRSPSAYTYTTILNALRHSTKNEIRDLPLEQQQENLKQLVGRAKGLWAEVVDKWLAGRMVIDEELVCAMGRLLVMSPDRDDKRSVLDLFEQMMNIPNLVSHPEAGAFNDETMRDIAKSGRPKPVPQSSKALYAVPGTNTLALILTTLSSARLTTSGIKYWNLLVRHYGVVPDRDIWLRMFGMLKVAKASGYASSILDILPQEYVEPKPFQIAMETCVRDNINPNAVKNSIKVLESMEQRLEVPDLHALRLHLRVALVSHYHLRNLAKDGNLDKAKRQYGVQIYEALNRLWEPYKRTHYHYFKAPKGDKKTGVLHNDKREVIALARGMFSAFNKIANEKMLPEEDLAKMRPIGAKINREIQSFYSNREEMEPNLPSAVNADRTKSQPESEERRRGDLEAANSVDADEPQQTHFGADFIWDTLRDLSQAPPPAKTPYPWETRAGERRPTTESRFSRNRDSRGLAPRRASPRGGSFAAPPPKKDFWR